MTTPKPKPDNAEQSQRFIETAKALEADKNPKAFEKALKIVVTPKKRLIRPAK